jgi:hypothetical protein
LRVRLEIGLLVLSIFACREQVPQPLVVDPYERWHSYNLHDYTVDQARMCYCVDGGLAVRITVRSDTIAVVTRLSDMTAAPIPASKWYLTVDSLFGIIRSSKGDSLMVSYNAQYGYPETLDINPQLHPVDGGVL